MNKTFILLGLLFITVPILAGINDCPAFTDSTCNTCRRIANCTSCGTANGRQVCTACVTGFYPNALSSACVNCQQATGETKCTACQYDESLVRTKCIACIDGNGINTLNQCVPCSINNCESCKVDDNGDKTCNTCKVGYVKSDSKTCKACSSNCVECSSDATTCIECINTGFYIKEKVCVECSKLTEYCANCTNTQCEYCASGYALSSDHKCFKAIDNCYDQETADGTCKTCDDYFFLSTDKTKCTPVDVPNCRQYTTNTNDCTECNYTYYLIPATTTPVAAASCGSCIANCLKCNDDSTCITCDSKFFYDDANKKCTQCTTNCNSCSKSATCKFCAVGYYGDGTSTCTQCPASLANCADCSDATTCTLCKDGFWKDGKTCLAGNISNCALQYAAAECDICDEGYLRSLNNGDACVACGNVIPGCADCYWNSDYIYNPLVCYICKSGYTLVNQVCVPCPFGCSNCNITTVNSANTILDEGLVLAEVKNQYSAYTQAISCQVCASGLHAVDGTCLACPVYCNNCSYSIHNQTGDYPQMGVSLSCQSCAAGTVLVDGTCLPCPVYCNNCSYSIHNITGVYPQMNVSLSCQSCAAGYTLSTDGANSGVCIKEKSSISSYLIFGLLQIIAIAFFLI